HTSPISLYEAGRKETDFPLEFGIVSDVLNQYYRRAIPNAGYPKRIHQRRQLAQVRSIEKLRRCDICRRSRVGLESVEKAVKMLYRILPCLDHAKQAHRVGDVTHNGQTVFPG